MGKIEKLKKGAATIYPATIPQAVVDPTSGKSVRAELDERADHGYDSAPKTLKEVDEAKIDKTSIVGETGQGETSVMSQKAVTDELGTKASHGYESSPKTLKEVDEEKADHGYASIEVAKTLKEVDDDLVQLAGDVSLFKEESNLKDAIQDSKIKDIESIISTMNPNQSAQLSVTGVSPLSLPKNAANGGMQVKLEGLTAENLVVNGDFRNGMTGWTLRGNHSTSTVIDGILNIVATGNGDDSGGGDIYRNIPRVSGNKYYITFMYKNNGGDTCILNVYTPVGKTRHTISDAYQKYSNVVTSGSTGSIPLHIYATEVTSGANILFDNFMVINLTETFGAGNEPTVEECDAMFADYFEGVKSFEPTGRVRSVDKNGLNPTHLYLTAPELRSNGTVKDEIRKGVNGYELVKRVGVGDAKLVTDSFTFETGFSTGTSVAGKVYTAVNATGFTASSGYTIKNNYLCKVKFEISNYSQGYVEQFYSADTDSYSEDYSANGIYERYYKPTTTTGNVQFRLTNFTGTLTILEIIDYSSTDGIMAGQSYTLQGSNIHYTLATPVIIPISYGGVLNSAENGTVYHEPIIADAGVYDTKIDILLTDYPIASIEEIIKHENGVDTYLDVATAVVASDGLSFTHPDLADGDLVLFTYAFDKESTNGNITATFYDSNVVKIDTVTGKAYKIEDVVTNGVLTRTLTEV